jgi:hypothetical protein
MASTTDNFDYELCSDQATAAKVLALKKLNIENPRNFKLIPCGWNETILRRIIDIFRHFSESDKVWETLEITSGDGWYSGEVWQQYIRPLLFAANTMSLFKRLKLPATIPDGSKSGRESFLSGATLNRNLEALDITCPFEMSVGDCRTLKLLLETDAIKELRLRGMRVTSDQPFLRQLLAANKSLQLLTLDCLQADDRVLSNVITALEANTNLQELTIYTVNQFGDWSSRALQMLLMSSSSLKKLTLQDKNPQWGSGKLNAEHILKGMTRNRSLKYLSITNALYGDLVVSRFFQTLHKCPNLEQLDLLKTKVTIQDLECIKTMDRLPKSIVIQMDRRIIKEYTSTFYDLLCQHPEARQPWPKHIQARSKKGCRLQHIWEMNWHGRYLLYRHHQIPLSLWPMVLKNANEKANVTYELLKGPAFAAKQSLEGVEPMRSPMKKQKLR